MSSNAIRRHGIKTARRPARRPPSAGPGVAGADWFQALHGLLRGTYDDEGGGEAHLRRQRQRFFGGGRRP